jgi:DNA polymerase (family 10)
MENKEIASVFKLVGQIMELHGENKFKTRSYTNAAFQISKYPDRLLDLDPSQLETIPGIGKNLVPKLMELLESGEMSYLQKWQEQTPVGVIQMLGIKGLGPSKVRTIWQEMELESPGELLYACNENRLIDLKGFGEKTQASVKASIEFIMEHESKTLYASVHGLIDEILEDVSKNNTGQIALVGEAAMKNPVLDQLSFIVDENIQQLPETDHLKTKVHFDRVAATDFELEKFKRSAAKKHLSKLKLDGAASAEQVYTKNNLPFLPPELRQGTFEFDWLKNYDVNSLVTNEDLLGCLHNHSTYSDGIHTLEDMAVFLKDKGYQYLGISDHSQTAVYAGGLKPEKIVEQQAEINKLNASLAPFKILKGIESDILSDGRLDYETEVLASFDFIVASIHSAMKMDQETATKRLITAIENPFTKILGHPTGRLLLSRPGYPIDHKKVIDACADNGVCIELNANPMRLDIDHTWIPYCMEKGVMISINPDAHRKEGFQHMEYGVMAARRGGLTKEFTLNALSLLELENWFNRK